MISKFYNWYNRRNKYIKYAIICLLPIVIIVLLPFIFYDTERNYKRFKLELSKLDKKEDGIKYEIEASEKHIEEIDVEIEENEARKVEAINIINTSDSFDAVYNTVISSRISKG